MTAVDLIRRLRIALALWVATSFLAFSANMIDSLLPQSIIAVILWVAASIGMILSGIFTARGFLAPTPVPDPELVAEIASLRQAVDQANAMAGRVADLMSSLNAADPRRADYPRPN